MRNRTKVINYQGENQMHENQEDDCTINDPHSQSIVNNMIMAFNLISCRHQLEAVFRRMPEENLHDLIEIITKLLPLKTLN